MAAPGWYQDPNDPAGQRWWDGTRWTEHTQHASAGSGQPAAEQAERYGGSPGHGQSTYGDVDRRHGGQVAGQAAAASPGWYQDPNDPSVLRWWDGSGWTANVHRGDSPSPVPMSNPPGYSSPSPSGAPGSQSWAPSGHAPFQPHGSVHGFDGLQAGKPRRKLIGVIVAGIVFLCLAGVAAVALFGLGPDVSVLEEELVTKVEEEYASQGYQVVVVSVDCNDKDFSDGDTVDTECVATLEGVEGILPLKVTGEITAGVFSGKFVSKYNLVKATDLEAAATTIAVGTVPGVVDIRNCQVNGSFAVLEPGTRFTCSIVMVDGTEEPVTLEASADGQNVRIVDVPDIPDVPNTEPRASGDLVAFCAAYEVLGAAVTNINALPDDAGPDAIRAAIEALVDAVTRVRDSSPDELRASADQAVALYQLLGSTLADAGYVQDNVDAATQALMEQAYADAGPAIDEVDTFAATNCQ